ncbi:MAG: UDP-N-acetylmuramoyl-tripeptide--D-alanyl-D-alanine ligase [Pseudomonadota bacterium]|nr:UDP-N-acetylmuramoyl-tripeptide--D-alanyl-D-alanine ligase [Pseudomonadota bacterium]
MTGMVPKMAIGAAELARRTGGSWAGATPELAVTGIEIDSRRCNAGSLFAALPGQHADGHGFVAAAAENGAVAALVSQPVADAPCRLLTVGDVEAALTSLGAAGRDAHRDAGGRLVAITGSVGKTGSKEMLAHMLRRLGGCHANRASFNNHLGVPLTLAALPAAPLPAVQEIGMNAPGEISLLTGLAKPDIAVITRIADSHAGFFDSLDDIAAAKAEIFDGLAPDGTAVLNADDPYFDMLAAPARAAGAGHIIGFGTSDAAEARLIAAHGDETGMTVNAEIGGTELEFRIGMRGAHWAHNALAMLAAVHALGLDIRDASDSLIDFNDLPGRGQVTGGIFEGRQMTLIDDSYNAGPASMAAAFATLATRPPQIMVLSDMLELGRGSADAHAALAPAVAQLRPRLVITIGPEMAEMAAGLAAETGHVAADTPAAATDALRAALEDGDQVFIKGSNGSGAWRVAAALLDGLSSLPVTDGGASHAA